MGFRVGDFHVHVSECWLFVINFAGFMKLFCSFCSLQQKGDELLVSGENKVMTIILSFLLTAFRK